MVEITRIILSIRFFQIYSLPYIIDVLLPTNYGEALTFAYGAKCLVTWIYITVLEFVLVFVNFDFST